MQDDLDVSVVISTYNRADVLWHALESLLQQEPPGLRYEIVVVDNNFTDSTRAVVESFIARGCPNLRYLFEPRQGVAYGRNTGILASKAPIIAFTDDDVTVAPGLGWCEFHDNRAEKANWGLVTLSDNAYDGKEAVRVQGKDRWGFPTGGEERDDGDLRALSSRDHKPTTGVAR